MSPSAETVPIDVPADAVITPNANAEEAAPTSEAPEQVETDKPRRPREEYPEFEDPGAELSKLDQEMVKPDRSWMDEKINKLQAEVDTDKKRTERITKELDNIKIENQRRKQQGSGEMEVVRNKLREIKSKIVATIDEKKMINADIEAVRDQKRGIEERVRSAKSAVGNFKTNAQIDEEIARIDYDMQHQSWSIKEEKQMILRKKELEASRSNVKLLETLEQEEQNAKASHMPELYEARKARDVIIDALKVEEAEQAAIMEKLKEKRSEEIASNNFSELFEERAKVREGIGARIAEIKTLREEFRKSEDAFYKNDRLIRELKRQVYKKNKERRDAERKEWQEKMGEDGEDGEELPCEEEVDEDGQKMMDWELAEKIVVCEQLIAFLQGYKPNMEETKLKSAPQPVEAVEGAVVRSKGLTGSGALNDDPLGLNVFMVEEVVSAKKSKKDKKRAKNAAKGVKVAQPGEAMFLSLSLDVMNQFSSLSLPTPTNTDDVDGSLAQLNDKKSYFEEKGKLGMTYKEIVKEEKAVRSAARNAEMAATKAAEEAKKAATEAEEAAKRAAEEEALAKIKAAEEAAFLKKKQEEEEEAARKKAAEEAMQKKKEEAEAAAAAKAAAAKAAEEAAAAKAAAAEQAIAVAKAAEEAAAAKAAAAEEAIAAAKAAAETAAAEEAMLAAEAEAQAKAQAEKAREAKRCEEEAAAEEEKEDKFEAYLRQQGINVDDDDNEEPTEQNLAITPSICKLDANHNITVQLNLNPKGVIGASIEVSTSLPVAAAATAPVEFDLAAARAAAQGKQMSEEEKKARGLLYDTSKACAVREEEEDDDGEADFVGGDPFEGL